MIKDKDGVWTFMNTLQLAEVLISITDEQTMRNFLRDILTETEILEISARLEAARLLSKREKYDSIIRKTKLSSRTVARISDWLKDGCNGYAAALSILAQHHDHI